MRKSPNNIVFEAGNSKDTGLHSSVKVSVENFCSSNTICFVKVICCLIDRSFVCPFDEKYRSATGPLVHFLMILLFAKVLVAFLADP